MCFQVLWVCDIILDELNDVLADVNSIHNIPPKMQLIRRGARKETNPLINRPRSGRIFGGICQEFF